MKISPTREYSADVTHRVVPGTRRPRAARARRTPGNAVNTPIHERGIAFAGVVACLPRAAVVARRSRSASCANLGFFRVSAGIDVKTGGGSPARSLVARADGLLRSGRPSSREASRFRAARFRSGTSASSRSRCHARASRSAASDREQRVSTDRSPLGESSLEAETSARGRCFFFRREHRLWPLT